jgi:hypothetical protein
MKQEVWPLARMSEWGSRLPIFILLRCPGKILLSHFNKTRCLCFDIALLLDSGIKYPCILEPVHK